MVVGFSVSRQVRQTIMVDLGKARSEFSIYVTFVEPDHLVVTGSTKDGRNMLILDLF